MLRLSFVVPVYRDVECFLILRPRLLEQAERALAGMPFEPHFVVIDDTAGLDPQVRELRALPDTVVLTPPFNLGHQRAIVFGLRTIAPETSAEDLVVTVDADGEDRPEDLPRLLRPLLDAAPGARVLSLARRTKRRETVPFKLLYLGFKIFFRSLTGLLVHTGNFAAYRGWLLNRVVFHPHFDLCYSSTLLSLNLPAEFVPCERGSRYAGRSRMGYFKLLVHGVRMLMPFIDRIAIRACVAFSLVMGLGVALFLAVGVAIVLTGRPVPGWTTALLLTALVLMTAFVALTNLVVLFTLFSQSQGVSLSGLDRPTEGSLAASVTPKTTESERALR
jgi:polyisoprenyl-phosphate glycosyltransferase